jgi:hypothetical protein
LNSLFYSAVLKMMRTVVGASFRRFGTVTEAFTRAAIKVVDGPKHVGKIAVAARDLKAGTVINEFSAPVFRGPTMHTVCLTNGIHVPPTFGAECISHACGLDTNISMVVQPDARSVKVVVTKDTACGEDLCFNYNTTEWTMSCPFECSCHSCRAEGQSRLVRGFAYLSAEEQDELINHGYVSPYIRSLTMRQRILRASVPAVQEKELISVAL